MASVQRRTQSEFSAQLADKGIFELSDSQPGRLLRPSSYRSKNTYYILTATPSFEQNTVMQLHTAVWLRTSNHIVSFHDSSPSGKTLENIAVDADDVSFKKKSVKTKLSSNVQPVAGKKDPSKQNSAAPSFFRASIAASNEQVSIYIIFSILALTDIIRTGPGR